MKQSALKKSSFTLPRAEIPLIKNLRKRLKLHSNTEVVRLALKELSLKFDREQLRQSFREASTLVQKANAKEMAELDQLAGEALE